MTGKGLGTDCRAGRARIPQPLLKAGRRAEADLNASGSIIQFDNVGLRYGTGAETLSDLTFSLREGGFYFLTGPPVRAKPRS
jgi:ABC-type multidrug transport system fused ATPase/permease subunit